MTKGERNILLELYHKLYGEGTFEGDIPEIKAHLKDLNGNVLKNTIRSVQNERDIKRLSWAIGGILLIVLTLIGCIIAL